MPLNKLGLVTSIGLGLAGIAGAVKLVKLMSDTTIQRLAVFQPLLDPRTPLNIGLQFEEVWFRSRDGLKLHGWYIPAEEGGPGRATIITAHGHMGSKVPDLEYAAFFHGAGYGVFMFDFRGHGQSEGPLGTSMGYWERFDVAGAVDWLLGRGRERIAIFGISMGGSIAILAAAENSNIRAVVADSPYAFLRHSIVAEINNMLGIPTWLGWPAGYLAYYFLARHHDFSSREGHPADVVAQIAPRPLLLIHGEKDRLTRLKNAHILYQRAGQPKELWVQPGLSHVQGYQVYGPEYERRVLEFLDRVDWEVPSATRPPARTLEGLVTAQP